MQQKKSPRFRNIKEIKVTAGKLRKGPVFQRKMATGIKHRDTPLLKELGLQRPF